MRVCHTGAGSDGPGVWRKQTWLLKMDRVGGITILDTHAVLPFHEEGVGASWRESDGAYSESWTDPLRACQR